MNMSNVLASFYVGGDLPLFSISEYTKLSIQKMPVAQIDARATASKNEED